MSESTKFNGTKSCLFSCGAKYVSSQLSQNNRGATTTPVGKRGKKPVGKR